MDIVLDTNCLIMAISNRNAYHTVWIAFLRGEYTLCISNEILEEYAEVITRNINERVAEMVINVILTRKNVRRVNPHFRFRLIEKDPDDNKFVDCAIACGAKYIVTQDHHFDILKRIDFPSVEVLLLSEFVILLN